MKIAYFQPFSGASGDMTLGALVDAGLPLEELEAGLRALGLPGWRLEKTRVLRGAFAATRVRVIIDWRDASTGAHFGSIGVDENIIDASWQAILDAVTYTLYNAE